MLPRKITGLGLIALSTFLIWNALSNGSITFTDDDDPSIQETITPTENPNLFTTLILGFGSVGAIGIYLLATTEALERKREFEDENGQFHWAAKSFLKHAASAVSLSYFGMTFGVATLICIYFSDFSTARTNIIMASLLATTLAARLLLFASNAPQQITANETELIIKNWIRSPRLIQLAKIEKTTITQKRISIWYNDTQQLAFASELLPEGALQALRKVLKTHAP